MGVAIAAKIGAGQGSAGAPDFRFLATLKRSAVAEEGTPKGEGPQAEERQVKEHSSYCYTFLFKFQGGTFFRERCQPSLLIMGTLY